MHKDSLRINSFTPQFHSSGRIQISEATWQLLKDCEEWQPTGGIEVKGKGLMNTYLWQGESAAAHCAQAPEGEGPDQQTRLQVVVTEPQGKGNDERTSSDLSTPSRLEGLPRQPSSSQARVSDGLSADASGKSIVAALGQQKFRRMPKRASSSAVLGLQSALALRGGAGGDKARQQQADGLLGSGDFAQQKSQQQQQHAAPAKCGGSSLSPMSRKQSGLSTLSPGCCDGPHTRRRSSLGRTNSTLRKSDFCDEASSVGFPRNYPEGSKANSGLQLMCSQVLAFQEYKMAKK